MSYIPDYTQFEHFSIDHHSNKYGHKTYHWLNISQKLLNNFYNFLFGGNPNNLLELCFFYFIYTSL